MAIVIPRSLKDPVGLAPSTLSHTRAPTRSDSRGAGTNGVPPSRRVTTGVCAATGRSSRYSSITPRQPAATSALRAGLPGLVLVGCHDPQHATHPVDLLEAPQSVERGAHVALAGHVGEEDESRLVAQPQLLHGAYGHAVVAEHVGHGGQDAGAVHHVEAEVEGRPQLVYGHE